VDEGRHGRPIEAKAKIVAKTAISKTRPIRFKENLRSLIASAGMTQREFADKLDLPYNWIRKSCNDGIARSHPKNEKSLRAICDFFNLSQIDSLWGKRVASTEWKTEDLAEQHREFVDDLNWLLKEFPGDHNVAEVKRVIGEVVEYIRRPASPNQDAATEGQSNPKLRAAKPRAERFKTNLRHLIEVAGMTQKAFALRIDISYIWLRKSCTNGVAQLHPMNEKYIRAICDFFRLRNIESLWDGRLIAKRLQSIDDVADEQRMLVADLIRLLKEHGDSQDSNVRSHIVEVKRVIAKVVKHLYVPKEKPAPAPERQRPQRTMAETTGVLDKCFDAQSTMQEPLQRRAAFTTPTRDVRTAEVNRKNKYYFDDIDNLDDQIDGFYAADDNPDGELNSGNSAEDTFHSWVAKRINDPTSEHLEELNRISQPADAFIRSLPESLRGSLEKELIPVVYRAFFNEVPPELIRQTLDELLLSRRIAEFIDGLPESLRTAFTEDDLIDIVENQMAKGVSSEKLRRSLDKIGEVRGVDADPDIIKKRKRIRRRQIPRHRQK
jgi:transcriptional regulator with XRE-family HTH domain